jgi:ABC-type dipeptide/oligopeptide/nickel transport system permease component
VIAFLCRRAVTALLIVWCVATLVFFCMRLIPADPAEVVLGDQATAQSIAAFRHEAGLDRPLLRQYVTFIRGVCVGDLGKSLINGTSVAGQIETVLPYTIALSLTALLVGALIGIPTGVLTAVKRNTRIDLIGRVFALLGFSFPAFYLGVLLLLVFSVWLGWFPVIHSMRGASLGEHVQKLVLPSLTLGIIQAAYITRLTRSTMLDVLRQDYVRTAIAKGVGPMRVYFVHALRNVLIPVVTAMGLYTGTILGGAILTETVFSRPGLGKLLVGAIAQRDYNLIQGGVIVFALMIMAVNLLVDLSYSVIDPRVRHG